MQDRGTGSVFHISFISQLLCLPSCNTVAFVAFLQGILCIFYLSLWYEFHTCKTECTKNSLLLTYASITFLFSICLLLEVIKMQTNRDILQFSMLMAKQKQNNFVYTQIKCLLKDTFTPMLHCSLRSSLPIPCVPSIAQLGSIKK